jgi:hypothetical protein
VIFAFFEAAKLYIFLYYCPVKNGIGKKAMLNGCKIAVE